MRKKTFRILCLKDYGETLGKKYFWKTVEGFSEESACLYAIKKFKLSGVIRSYEVQRTATYEQMKIM